MGAPQVARQAVLRRRSPGARGSVALIVLMISCTPLCEQMLTCWLFGLVQRWTEPEKDQLLLERGPCPSQISCPASSVHLRHQRPASHQITGAQPQQDTSEHGASPASALLKTDSICNLLEQSLFHMVCSNPVSHKPTRWHSDTILRSALHRAYVCIHTLWHNDGIALRQDIRSRSVHTTFTRAYQKPRERSEHKTQQAHLPVSSSTIATVRVPSAT